MKKIPFWIGKVLTKTDTSDIFIVCLFIIFFLGIGYWLTIMNPLFLTTIRIISDVLTLLILGFVFGYSLIAKNIRNKSLVSCAAASMFIMYILYDVYHIGTTYAISAAGFNVATSLNILTLYFVSKNK